MAAQVPLIRSLTVNFMFLIMVVQKPGHAHLLLEIRKSDARILQITLPNAV